MVNGDVRFQPGRLSVSGHLQTQNKLVFAVQKFNLNECRLYRFKLPKLLSVLCWAPKDTKGQFKIKYRKDRKDS